MIRQLVILITTEGVIKLAGDDLPDLSELEALVGTQPLDNALRELGLDTELNSHLCG